VKRNAEIRSKSSNSTEVDLLWIQMIKRGLTTRDLARMTGLSVGAMRTAFSLSFPCRRTRARVESALELPIWSSPEQLSARRLCEARLGIVPAVASASALVSAADRAGIDLCGSRRPKTAVLRCIEEFFAAHPSFKTTTHAPKTHEITPH
jgi:hypothetical protein